MQIQYKISAEQSLSREELINLKLYKELTDIPENWWHRKLADLKGEYVKEIIDKLINWDYCNPIITSIISKNNGIGKTHIASCIYKKFIHQKLGIEFDKLISGMAEQDPDIPNERIINWITGGNFYSDKKPKWKFLSEKVLALQIQESFNSKTESQLDILNSYCNLEFLVIDDMFSMKQNEFARQNIFYIIDERCEWKQKPTFITSNLSLKEIAEIDTRIADRIRNKMLFNITDVVDSYRKNIEQLTFKN